jgi:4-amino-4-deoxy-L-arabinose transferase-like glycosyltransferase
MTSVRHLVARPAFIFVVALILRLGAGAIFLRGHDKTIDSTDSFTEGSEAIGIARSLASGNGFGSPWSGAGPTAWLTPVMPAILAADMLVFGLHTRATLVAFVVFNEFCSALTIFPVFFTAWRIAGGQGEHRIAALAAWLCVLDPPAVALATRSVWYTTLSGLLAALLLWATLAVRDSKKLAPWIGYGLLWGLELMTHPSFLLLMPVALLWLVWVRPGVKSLDSERVKLPALACFAAVVCCVPWTARNYEVFHHLVPLRSNFGFELWLMNHGGRPLHPNSDPGERDAFSSLGERAYVREKQKEAFAWIGAHPGAYLVGGAKRVLDFWFDMYKAHRHRGGWFFKAKTFYSCVLVAAMLGGLIAIRRRRHEYFWLLASCPFFFLLSYYIASAREYHRVPIDPVLAIIAAVAVTLWLPDPQLSSTGRLVLEA